MIRSRLAPTPSGYMHIGNALNFVITWVNTRQYQGTLRLRIDDLDAPRIRPEYVTDIFRTLEWLGLDWDEGPQTPDEHKNSFSQHLRLDRYQTLIEQMIQSGQAFACHCSRKGLLQHQCQCKHQRISFTEADNALKIFTPENSTAIFEDVVKGKTTINLYDAIRDFIIRRRDGIPAYQLVSLADDIDFNINFIIRGQDLLPSTAAQLLLSAVIGDPTFAQSTFYHHPILNDEQGMKLSKSAGSVSLKAWREAGKTPADFYTWMSNLVQLNEPVTTLKEMLEAANAGAELKFG